ncbi:hemolysin family protein [Sphingobium sp. Sx8-8]|uniref:hemolysin family protein n=1 Tax=Sphingobium sp. Sx8-8 TaxID=2933617 RepID=UPI001F5659CA|nr:hemolysin family protein [Sphingobium sp. Sx8-8]
MANIPPHAPTPFPWVDIIIILALVALNGLFAMSELAIVSARKPRLQAMEKTGRRGARSALAAAADPGKFLSTVQIGITLIGIVAGAYSGASLGGPTGERLQMLGLSPHVAQNVGFALVIGLTTYASLIVGELVPKQFALRAPESIAVLVAGPMLWLAKITAPIVWVLDGSSALIFRLLGLTRESENQVTAEELHLIVAEASKSGVIEESERAIISGVVRLADRPVREVMTQRMDVDWIDIGADEEAIRAKLLATPHTRLPVGRGTVEEIIGVVQARDIMTALFRGEGLNLEALMRKVEVVPDQVDAMDALEVLRRAEVPMVMVHDEYGHFEGIATPADLLSAIAGHFVSDLDSADEPDLVEREDGSLLVSGQMPMDLLAERIGIDLPEDRDYATVAGHTLWLMKRLPEVGDYIDDQGWRFEVVDMDGRKIDKLLVAER